MNTTNRSTVNEAQYAAPEFPKSGFNLGYKKYSSYQLGKLHISGYQWTMPADKISGQNIGNFTFNRIVTPMVAPVDVGQYNFYLPLRACDRTFERGIVPTKLNGMSANWKCPSFSLQDAVKCVCQNIFGVVTAESDDPFESLVYILSRLSRLISDNSPELVSIRDFDEDLQDSQLIAFLNQFHTDLRPFGCFKSHYMVDWWTDYLAYIRKRVPFLTNDNASSINAADYMYNWLDAVLSPFVGRYSYLAELGYNYLSPADIYRLCYTDYARNVSISTMFDSTPMNEYPLRAMYIIWYERFRDVNLEPVSSSLPDWHDFGSTSLIADGDPIYLIYRFRSWSKDVFTTSQIDDISRHVFAPIVANDSDAAAFALNPFNTKDTALVGDPKAVKPSIVDISYRNNMTGAEEVVSCPVPSNVNDILSSIDASFSSVYGLDLNTLRQSQMLEKYLKRNYLFGDEYADRMLAHYNSRVSDMRINKPELLSSSLNSSNMEQQVSNVSTDETKVGDRTATGTLASSGDQYTTFCEEFGIIINLITFMPKAAYNGLCPQLLISKQIDFPLPEFAANNEEFGRKIEIAKSGLYSDGIYPVPGQESLYVDASTFMFGRYPAYHAWRSRVDEVGGMFLNELQNCTFRRFWGLESDESTPKLNYEFLHCKPNLEMFANTLRYDSQLYGDVVHECFVERVLPTPVEVI